MNTENTKLQGPSPIALVTRSESSEKKNPENPYIYDSSNCLADWLYLYAKRIIDVGNSKPFSPEDMYRLNEQWTYKEMYPKFLASYTQLTNKGWSFRASFYGAFLWRICYALGQWLVGSLVGLLAPVYVKKLIYWMRTRGGDDYGGDAAGWYYAGVMIVTVMVRLVLKRRSQFESVILQFEVGQCMRGLVYNKFETLSTEAIRNLDIGRLSNTISSDVGQIQLALRMIQVLIVTPVVLIVVSIYLLVEFGWFALTIPVVFSLVIGMQFFINSFTTRYIAKKRELADKRTKFVGEVLMGIKNIKFQAWEDIALKKVEDIRGEEVEMLGKYISLRVFGLNFTEMIGSLSILIFFVLYNIAAGHPFNLEDTALFTGFVGQMIGPMRMLTQSLDRLNSANISLGRIEKVIKTVDAVPKVQSTSFPKGTVIFRQFTGGWYSKEQTEYFSSNQDKVDSVAIRDIDITFQPGKLYAILGEVGSGKSSLLLGALQDLVTKKGSIDLHGDIAYVPQNAFLLNASIRDNIVFGQPYDEARYKDTVISCCLLDDLKQLPGGDRTEVGERGINLSGGQKQRIAIARALYAQRDIYLVDDCLSALDAEVGKRIFFDVIKNRLQGKTVIMVTHATNILSLCDDIVLMKNGRVAVFGPYDSIKSHRDFNEYFRSQQKPHSRKSSTIDPPEAKPDSTSEVNPQSPTEIPAPSTLEPPADTHKAELQQLENLFFAIGKKAEDKLTAKGALTKKEGRNKGLVQVKYLWMYCEVYGRTLFGAFVVAVAVCTALRILSDYWVGYWAKGSAQGGSSAFYFIWHLVINILLLGLIVCRSNVHSTGIMKASFTISQRLTRGVLRNTLEYFDTTPVGVIINRFTKDIDIMDSNLAHFISQFMGNFFIVFETLALMVLTIPYMLVFVVIAVMMFFRMSKKLLVVSSDIRRLSLMASSPILSNISESLQGCLMIRTYGVFEGMKSRFIENLQKLGLSELHEKFMQTYVFQMIELTSGALLTAVVVSVILVTIYPIGLVTDPNILAVCITWSSISTEWVGMLLFSYQELNSGINCVERLHEMTEPVKPEASYETPVPPSTSWPSEGRIEFSSLNVRYRENLPLVLKNITLDVMPKQKVGIVGRTGSGKSTLILALKRMVGFEGTIKIDGVSITEVGLKYSRGAVGLIPQDPFLLSGTMRSNIDPEMRFTDVEIVNVLKMTAIYENLWDTINRLDQTTKEIQAASKKTKKAIGESEIKEPLIPKSDMVEMKTYSEEERSKTILAYQVKEGGSNLSQGQRQLICIARAIIAKPRILLMDEATANIDSKTDQLIQRIIKREFLSSTVLTIAHRLNTIIQYDRVVVLANGEVSAEGSPLALLDSPGVFQDLVRELGETNFAKMRAFAADHSLDPVLD